MPPIVHGEPGSQKTDFSSIKANYTYPNELDLRPGRETHTKIKDLILEYANASNKAMSNRFDSWNEIDRTLTTYMPVDEEEAKVKNKDPRRPVSIVFPYSYAMLETLLTYLFVAFVQEPIFRYEAASPEDVVGGSLLEMVVNLHCNKTKVALALHTMFRDALGYGIGVVAPDWIVKKGQRVVRGSTPEAPGGEMRERFFKKIEEDVVLFEGNALNNIDPYRYLPDPNFAIQEQQKGEFQGWIITDNLNNLLREEKTDPDLFNAEYIKAVQQKRSKYGTEQSLRQEKTGWTRDEIISDRKNAVDIIYCQIDLIPSEYGLSDSDDPEKWEFGLAADEVIISANKNSFAHQMYPIVTCAPDFDGYTTTPISRLEVMYGLQGVLDFMFNSHIANVRKAINDMLVVDPQMVNIKDLKDPGPGKLIRLRRPAWGKSVKDAVYQLNVQDITRSHIPEAGFIVEWMERVMGADASMGGTLRKGGPERLTKAEFSGTRQGSISRLERMARVIGLQAMQDIGYMFAVNAQQMMGEETFARITGRWTEDMLANVGWKGNEPPDRLRVSPYDILVDYDVLIRDGSVPGGNFNEAELTLFTNIIEADPEVRSHFDIFRIFEHIAKRMGWKNIEDYRRNVNQIQGQVMPDEEVERQVQAGNLIPTG